MATASEPEHVFTVVVPQSLRKAVKLYSYRRRRKIKDVVQEAIRESLKKRRA